MKEIYNIPDLSIVQCEKEKHKPGFFHTSCCSVFFSANPANISFIGTEYVHMVLLNAMDAGIYLSHIHEIISESYRVLLSGRKLCAILPNNDTGTDIYDRLIDKGFTEKTSFIVPVNLKSPIKVSDYFMHQSYARIVIFQKNRDASVHSHLSMEQRAASLLSPDEATKLFRSIWVDTPIEETDYGYEIPCSLFIRIIRMFAYAGDYIYCPIPNVYAMLAAIETKMSTMSVYHRQNEVMVHDSELVKHKAKNVYNIDINTEIINNPYEL